MRVIYISFYLLASRTRIDAVELIARKYFIAIVVFLCFGVCIAILVSFLSTWISRLQTIVYIIRIGCHTRQNWKALKDKRVRPKKKVKDLYKSGSAASRCMESSLMKSMSF